MTTAVKMQSSLLPFAIGAHQPRNVWIGFGDFTDVQLVQIGVNGERRREAVSRVHHVVLVDVRHFNEVQGVAQLRHGGAGALPLPPARHHVLDLLGEVVGMFQLDVGDHAQRVGVRVDAGKQRPRQIFPLFTDLHNSRMCR